LPESLKFEYAALIEPSTVARHILDLGDFKPGQTAIVLGAGSVGLMAVQWLRILGAKLIICTDVVDSNLTTAEVLGAHVTLNPTRDNIKERVKELVGDGVDLAIEAAGSPQALAQTIQVTRPRGSVVCGGNQPLDATLPMTFIEDLMRKELQLNGCFMSYSAPFPGHEWTESIEALCDGRLDMETVISHRYPLSQVVRIFEDIAAHRLAHKKIILLPEESV
jgi:L-iditol 2-dehydrogenase